MARSNLRIGPGGRGPNDPWFTIGTFEVGTAAIAALLGAVSILLYAVSKTLLVNLALIPSDVRHGQLWRLITWPLANLDPTVWLVFGVFLLYWFGRDIERLVGRTGMAQLFLVVIVVGAFVAFLLDTPIPFDPRSPNSITLLEHACLVGFAVEHAAARFMFNIPAWVVAAVVVGIDLIRYVGDENYQGVAITVAVIAATILSLRAMGFAATLPWVPKIPWPGSVGRKRSTRTSASTRTAKRARGGRKRADLRVVDTSSNTSSTVRGVAPDIDVLLDKISKHGIDSLSADERRALEQTSSRLRDEKKSS